MGASRGAGITYPNSHLRVGEAQSLVFCVVFLDHCLTLFPLSFDSCIVFHFLIDGI